MAHGFGGLEQGNTPKSIKKPKGKMGSRRIFSPQFKLQVLDSYRNDTDCRGNQRATARKYGIHRRQIQKWLQMESNLRCSAEGASENQNDVALNLASARQRDDTNIPGCLSSSPSPSFKTEINVDKISDSEDDYSQEEALDFTCAALSKRRFFSLDFKLEVLNAFYNDPSCYGNQRATARKFNIHRRQVQKWLNHEISLRNQEECLDLSKKRTILDLDTQVQETALCLVKEPESKDIFRPYLCCTQEDTQQYEICWDTCCSYYTPIHSCVTKWLNQDAHYYKQAVKDINLYSPMFS